MDLSRAALQKLAFSLARKAVTRSAGYAWNHKRATAIATALAIATTGAAWKGYHNGLKEKQQREQKQNQKGHKHKPSLRKAGPKKAPAVAEPAEKKIPEKPAAKPATEKPAAEKPVIENREAETGVPDVAFETRPGRAELVTLFSAAKPDGQILFDTHKNGDKARAIASITKTITFLLLAERIESGTLKWDQKFPFPEGAAGAPPTAMHIAAGTQVTIEELAGLMMIHSDNGAARALAIIMGGTKENFLKLMHAKMKMLNLKSFHFVSPDGYYVERRGLSKKKSKKLKVQNVGSPKQVTKLFDYIEQKHGEQLDHIYKMKHIFKGGHYHAHTRLLRCGPNENIRIKTGFTLAAGASLIASIRDPKDPNWKVEVFVGGFSGSAHPGAPRDMRALELIAKAVKQDGTRSLKNLLKYSAAGPYCGRFVKQYQKLAQ